MTKNTHQSGVMSVMKASKGFNVPSLSKSLKQPIVLLICLVQGVCTAVWSQTITDVYPTRVTEGVTVTIEGTGFTNAIRNSISFVNGGIAIKNKTVTPDGTIMTFDISRKTVCTSNCGDSNVDLNRQLQVTIGTTITPVIIAGEAVNLQYIAPKAMIHALPTAPENVIDDRIPVPTRVEEIYTDYGGVKSYADGDEFTRGSDFNSTTFGRWEFFGLVFPSEPSGVLVETGGVGRGMFIGFKEDKFIARGGDGRTPTAPGCARLELDADIFANKSGRLLVTLDPANGELTLEWDEGDDNIIELEDTIIATNNYLGYNQYREWSGGNKGFVGQSNNNIAGSEISGVADFNGIIGSMEFSNDRGAGIAWRSSGGVIPDNYHDLLGFKYDGVVYATGANNPLLEAFLGDEIIDNATGLFNANYSQSKFKAYSTYGIQNTTIKKHHIFTGEFVDGKELETPLEFTENTNPTDPDYDPAFDNIRGLNMFDVLIDGKNGLNIGSGINNINQSTSIKFFSGNGVVGGAQDAIPDLLIPNMAEAGGTDVYYYTDERGNVVGRPISIRINNSDTHNPALSEWQNDQYRVEYPGVSFDEAVPIERIYGDAQLRPMRLIAFTLQDFGITSTQDVDAIENINAGAGGTADIPFLAYNGNTFEIRTPEVTLRPKRRSICAVPSTIDVTFEVSANVDGGFSYGNATELAKEKLTFRWFKNNTFTGVEQQVAIPPASVGVSKASFNIPNVALEDLGLYKIKISNTYGSVTVEVDLEEGGIPAIWNASKSKWTFPRGFVGQNGDTENGTLTEVLDEDRRLTWRDSRKILSGEEIKGCDCLIPAGSVVKLETGAALNLYGELTLNPDEEEIIQEDDGTETKIPIQAGQLIIEDDASLVQRKDTDINNNIGEILMRRNAVDLNNFDYIYWSSPVATFDIDNIQNSSSYLWNTTVVNANGTDGNWEAFNGTMIPGKGYIARVPSSANFTTTFGGIPNNGLITQFVSKSSGSQVAGSKHWNLIGNPYPSAINVDKFLLHPANSRLEGAVYLWNQTMPLTNTPNPNDSPYYQNFEYNYEDAYITNNVLGAVPSIFNGNIAAGQGFFVKVDNAATAGNIEFRNTMRYNDGSNDALDNSEFFRSNTSNLTNTLEKQRIWLSIVTENRISSSTLIGYIDGASLGKDRLFDAYPNISSSELSIYSFIEQDKMAIQGRPLPFDESDIVYLGAQIPSAGIYSIGIDKLDGSVVINNETAIILEDTYTGTFHDLKDQPFVFNAQNGVYDDRFILRFDANQLLSVEEVKVADTFAFVKNNRLTVQSEVIINDIEVYDITGKAILQIQPQDNLTKVEIDFNFAEGVYIAVITLEGNVKTSVKLIN